VTLSKYIVQHSNQAAQVARVKTIHADLPRIIKEGTPVIFFGSWGTGKDHFMAGLLYAALRHASDVKWFSAQSVYGEFRDAMSSKRLEKHVLKPLLMPQVLGISDPIPPTGSYSGWNALSLYRILDDRYRRRRCTWMTLNAENTDDARRKLTPAVFERMIDQAIVVPCFWPSYRQEAQLKGK
jgi:DNA replication protein DnaC